MSIYVFCELCHSAHTAEPLAARTYPQGVQEWTTNSEAALMLARRVRRGHA